MTRQGGAASARQQAEPVRQAIEDLLHGQDSCSDRSQLDGQRQAVKPAANSRHRGLVRRRQLEGARGSLRPLDKEHDRLVLSQLIQRLGGVARRQLQGRDREHMLARHGQRFAGGGDETHIRGNPDDLAHEISRRSKQVLTVVDHQQQGFVLQVGQQERQRLRCRLVPQVESRHDCVADQRGIAHLRQLDQPCAVLETAPDVGCRPDG